MVALDPTGRRPRNSRAVTFRYCRCARSCWMAYPCTNGDVYTVGGASVTSEPLAADRTRTRPAVTSHPRSGPPRPCPTQHPLTGLFLGRVLWDTRTGMHSLTCIIPVQGSSYGTFPRERPETLLPSPRMGYRNSGLPGLLTHAPRVVTSLYRRELDADYIRPADSPERVGSANRVTD